MKEIHRRLFIRFSALEPVLCFDFFLCDTLNGSEKQ